MATWHQFESVEQQHLFAKCQRYADHLKQSGATTVYLWPPKGSVTSPANTWATGVLSALVYGEPVMGLVESGLAGRDQMEQEATQAGYTIRYVDPKEYTVKAIRAEIAGD